MDEMTQLRLMWLGGLTVVFGLAVAFGWILTTLAEFRERRESGLLAAVLAQLRSARVATRARAEARWGLLSRRPVVALDMGTSSDEEVWRAISRLSESLPRNVRLVVSTAGPHSPALAVKVATSLPRRPDDGRPAIERTEARPRAVPSDVSRNAA